MPSLFVDALEDTERGPAAIFNVETQPPLDQSQRKNGEARWMTKCVTSPPCCDDKMYVHIRDGEKDPQQLNKSNIIASTNAQSTPR